MGWKSVLFGVAAVVALAFGGWAQTASGPPVRLDPAQPRYATMVPPLRQETVEPEAPAPLPAPTTRVAAAPLDQTPVERASVAPAPPRYSTMQPPPDERVTVTGLRPSEDGLYRLGPGDKLRVTVFNESDLSGEFAIDTQGYVRLPLIGQTAAAGLSTFGLEGRIAEAFVSGGYLVNPRVAVEITTYRPFYIIGEVSKPGEYAYVASMSAPNAIALAGGYTDRATESTIWVRRQGEAKEREYPADESTRIFPGDVVRVSRTTYWSIMTVLAPIISPFSSLAYVLK